MIIVVAVLVAKTHLIVWDPMDCRLLCPWQEYWSGLSFPPPWGTFLTHGSSLCLLHWQVDSLLLSHQGNLITIRKAVFQNPMAATDGELPVTHM